jgi:hypothetical protein
MQTGERLAQHRTTALSDLPLVGRNRELVTLLRLVRSNTHALICGSHGLGKTRLMLEMMRILRSDGIEAVHLRFRQPPHVFLSDVAARLSVNSSHLSSVGLRGALWNAFESKPRLILLDDITDATPPFYRFFERIITVEGNIMVGSAAHSHATGSLQRIFWNPEATVSLQPLGKRDASILAESATRTFLVGHSLASDFGARVIQAARGNPGRIVDMCIRASDPFYRSKDDHIRFGALVMDSVTGSLS